MNMKEERLTVLLVTWFGSRYLSQNQLTSLEIPESWRHLDLLDVSENPIANITAEGKDGPRILVATNTNLVSMEDAVLSSTMRQL
ncbi:hypothetical protein GN244_ATG15673 [Phytophthora infestans]|uniref:Uncharacterized protein n=1 Tax=Phytophthora infestans TaxID=4787 RepID=A0A833SUW0_PHYIN|nr:hypothetical protein GN244_ATG15673 [Phytophthora infestans]